MISRTRHAIEVLAVLLCATGASAQDNRGTPSSVLHVRPMLSGSVAAKAVPARQMIEPLVQRRILIAPVHIASQGRKRQ